MPRSMRSTRPRDDSSRRSAGQWSLVAHDLHQQARGFHVELGAVHLDRRSVGRIQRLAALREPRNPPVRELQELELGVHAGEVYLHPFLVDDAPAVGQLRLLRPTANVVELAFDDSRRAQRDALVVQLVGDQRPALILLADEVAGGNAHVLVVGDVGVGPAEVVDLLVREARRVGRHDDDRDALVLLGLLARAHREPYVVGTTGEAREHLLAVDHVLVAVAHRFGLQRCQVGAGIGLGVPDREVDLTLQDLVDVELLLLFRSVPHDRRCDRVDGEHRHRRARAHRLVEEDELFDRRHAPAAPLLGPTDTRPAVAAHLLPHILGDFADTLALAQVVLDLGREQVAVVRAELVAQRLLLFAQPDVHLASASDSTTITL